MLPRAAVLLLLTTLHSQFSTASAQGTAFTYQGQLQNSGSPVNGLFDFRFRLDADPAGNTILNTVLTNAIPVTNGLFTTTIDFGPGWFNGSNYWLEVDVRTNNPGNTLAYTPLTPYQAFTPTPYVVFADTASNLTGTVSSAQVVSIGNNNHNNFGNAFIGTAGNADILGTCNTADGSDALHLDNVGSYNTAVGQNALYANLYGVNNTAVGATALQSLTGGSYNIALGGGAGGNLTGIESYDIDIGNVGVTGENNVIRIGSSQTSTFIAGVINGNGGGLTNLNASQLTSVGNTNGTGNFFVGSAGNSTTSGTFNTGSGFNALAAVTEGHGNTAYGAAALHVKTTGDYSTALGQNALYASISGGNNTAVGQSALQSLTNGSFNIAVGVGAGANFNASEGGNIDIGNAGLAGENSTIRIGSGQTSTFIAGVINGNGGGLTNLNAGSLGGSQLSTVNAQGVLVGTNIYLNNYPMYLRGDQNHGLAYSGGTVTNFGTGNVQVDGPVLWGFSGGALAVMNGGAHAVLTWTNGGVSVTGGFAFSSDRNMKTGFAALDAQEVLARVAAMPMSSWFYKTDTGARHVGPMAQDFHAAFALGGDDDKHINVGDEGGVALAAIQGLNQKLETQNAELKKQNDSLTERLNALEAAVKQLAEKN